MFRFAGKSKMVLASTLGLLGLSGNFSNSWAAPPQFVFETEFAGTWGAQGAANGEFSQPFGIARNSAGEIFVADISNARIQQFSEDGYFLAAFGSSGGGNGQFSSPSGVAVNSSDEIYVIDFVANRVQHFEANGDFIRTWGAGGAGIGEFQNPRNLAIGPGEKVYVADYGNDRIQIFESNGDFVRAFGTSGNGDGAFSFPDGIAVDGSGNVYVVDRGNHRVQVFDASDTIVRTWGSMGTGAGQFDSPTGLALGTDGIVYVTDYNNDRVQAFTTEGVFIGAWGTPGNGDGEFQGPNGVLATAEGRVYVSNAEGINGHRVQFFEPIWNVTMDEDGSPTPFSLTLQATDADMDTIFWSISSGASHGLAEVSGTGASKAIVYTPDNNYDDTDSFVVQISDGDMGIATRTVSVEILPVNDAPVIDQGDGPLTVTMSQDGSPDPFVRPTMTATEPDDDTILWSVSSGPGHGMATVAGSGTTPPIFSYTPPEGFIGTDMFTVQATDGILSDTIVIEVTVTHRPNHL